MWISQFWTRPTCRCCRPLSCARVNTGSAARIDDCVALGYPAWNDVNERLADGGALRTIKKRAQSDGYIPTGEGADPYAVVRAPELLVFKITTPEIRERRVEAGDLDTGNTTWGG